MIGPAIRPIVLGYAPVLGVPMEGECLRLKTDQRGFPEDIRDLTAVFRSLISSYPGDKGSAIIVRGVTSGAYGRYVRFTYTKVGDYAIQVERQQYIILADWVGPFVEDEDLEYYVTLNGETSAVDMGIDTAGDTATAPLTQVSVDCGSGRPCVPCITPIDETGGGTTTPGGTTSPTGTGPSFGVTDPCPPNLPQCNACIQHNPTCCDPSFSGYTLCICSCLDLPVNTGFFTPEQVFRDYSVQFTRFWPRNGPPVMPIAYDAASLPIAPGGGIGTGTTQKPKSRTMSTQVFATANVGGQDMVVARPLEAPGVLLPGATITVDGQDIVLANPLGNIKMVPSSTDTTTWRW